MRKTQNRKGFLARLGSWLWDKLGLNYTVMLVPHSGTRTPSRLKLPAGVFTLAFLLLFCLLSATTYFAYSSYRLQAVESENAGLKKITVEQEEQLEELEALSAEVLELVELTITLEDEFREKAGLEEVDRVMPSYSYGGVYEAYTPAPDALGDSELAARIDRTGAELRALTDYYTGYISGVYELEEYILQIKDEELCFPDAWPLPGGRVSSEFGVRIDPINLSLANHSAIDICGERGDPIVAAGRGLVVESTYSDTGYGLHIVIDHGNGYRTLYAHCDELFVDAGEYVDKGQTIATCGATGRATGYHLHFGVQKDGVYINPRSTIGWP